MKFNRYRSYCVLLSLAPSLYEEPPSLYEFTPSTEELETLVSSTSQPSTSSSLPLYDFPVDTSTYQPPLYEEPPIVMEETPLVKPKVLAQRPPPLYEEPPIYMPTEKYKKLAEEMMSTEERYLEDLVLAKKLFYQNLVKIVSKVQLDLVFLNWDQLIETSKRMLVRMRRQEPMGSLFLSEINSLSVFVTFCKGQQSALEAINTIMKSPDARALYTQCCASPHARGMTLNYFLMIPLGRITRYPLLVEKMLKETDSSLPEYQNLDDALQLLRALVTEVNQAVTEMDTVALLCWAQQHIKCPNIVPAIEFTSSTREMGNRMFLHSSVIYKARSGKLLVGILFNDFLLLTTPDETIAEPDSFRISKNTDTMLTLYKQPYLLNQLRVEQGKEGENFINLFYGDETIHLRCISNNSAKLWLKQIQQALDLYAIAISESQNNARKSRFTPMGRLLVEIMKLQNVTSKNVGHAPHCIRVRLGNETKVFDVDISKPEVQLTMQFEFESMECFFSVAIYQKRTFCPDLLVLEESNVKLRELVNESSKHRGPIMKHMHLRPVHTAKTELIVTKFGIQLYESDI